MGARIDAILLPDTKFISLERFRNFDEWTGLCEPTTSILMLFTALIVNHDSFDDRPFGAATSTRTSRTGILRCFRAIAVGFWTIDAAGLVTTATLLR